MASDKYMIAYLPSKEVSDYVTKLINELAEKFDEKYILENPRPVHATLKSPFEIEDIQPIENTIQEFVKEQKIADVSSDGFEDFRGKVFFMRTNFSEGAMQIQKDLIEKLRQFKEIYIDRYDEQFTPHLTVGYANSQESHDGIIDHLNTISEQEFDFKFDNLAILKKVGNAWEIHRRFELTPQRVSSDKQK